MLSPAGCRERQHRLLRIMEQAGVETAVLSRPKTILYLTGAIPDPGWPHALVLKANGDCTLVTNLEPRHEIAAPVRTYTGYTIHKVFGREYGHDEAVSLVKDLIGHGPAGVFSIAFGTRNLMKVAGRGLPHNPSAQDFRE